MLANKSFNPLRLALEASKEALHCKMHIERVVALTLFSYVIALPSDINLGVALQGCDVEACDMEVRISFCANTSIGEAS